MKRSLVLLTTLIMFGCGYGSNYKSMTGTTTSNGSVTISELTPNDIMHGASSFSLTVNGTGFGSDALVYFNSMPQSTTFITASQVMATIPAASVTNTGNISVYVRTGGMNSNAMEFVVQ
jgi:IPT/TIG domain